MSLEGITSLNEVLQKKATKTQKMRFWYFKGNKKLKILEIFLKKMKIVYKKLIFYCKCEEK